MATPYVLATPNPTKVGQDTSLAGHADRTLGLYVSGRRIAEVKGSFARTYRPAAVNDALKVELRRPIFGWWYTRLVTSITLRVVSGTTPDPVPVPPVPPTPPPPVPSPTPVPPPPTPPPSPTPTPPPPTPPPSPTPTPPPQGTANVAAGLDTAALKAALLANLQAGKASVLSAGATYTLTSTLAFSGVNGLTVDLNGATLKFTTALAVGLQITGCLNHRWTNGVIEGAVSSPTYDSGKQHHHGVHIDGGGTHYFDVTVRKFWGDGFYLTHYNGRSGNGIRFGPNTTIGPVGRMGWGVVAWDNGVIERGARVVSSSYRPLDFEPDWQPGGFSQTVRNWLVEGLACSGVIYNDNGSGTCWLFIGTPPYDTSGKTAPTISGITVRECSVTTTSPSTPHYFMQVSPSGYRVSTVRLERNSAAQSWSAGLGAADTDGLVVTDNDVTVTSPPWVDASNCTGVVQSGNG